MRVLLFLVLLGIQLSAYAGALKPGFDADEYIETLQRCSGHMNRVLFPKTAPKLKYTRLYKSPEMGLHNQWSLWRSADGATIAINLRGTVPATDNGMENIFAAMIPATGTLKMSDTGEFHYQFASHPDAMVHAGWSIGICSMIPDIVAHIREQYAAGVRQVVIEGHSQGGALAFLLRAYLHYQVQAGALPSDIVFKTYSSAAPKPGNLFFAYDYAAINRDGWAFSVVSSLDWVPEMPFSVQRYSDINTVNPFTWDKSILKKQKFFVRLVLNRVYNRTNRATRKAQRRFEHYLGNATWKFLRKYMPGAERPKFEHSFNYVPAGTLVVLTPDEAYYKQFAAKPNHIFMHHFFEQYYFLVRHIYKKEGV